MDIHHDLMTPREGEMHTHKEDMRQIAEAIQLEAAHCGRFTGTPLEKSLAMDVMAATAERDALAAQNVELRGALEEIKPRCASAGHGAAYGGLKDIREYTPSDMRRCEDTIESALALPLPAAAAKVEQWREKSELLEWVDANVKDVDFDYEYGKPRWEVWHLAGEVGGSPGQSMATGDTLLSALRAARGAK